MTKNFALIGVAGYIAPRHLEAIRDTGNRLIAALDPNDSVGVLDRYFRECHFFTEFERFDRHLDKLSRRSEDERVHYVSICSPNYLHDAHIRFALRSGASAICEKPLVLNPWNLDALEKFEEQYGRKVSTVLQLRLHPALIALRSQFANTKTGKGGKHSVNLTYITSRGNWYLQSWKGKAELSGGLLTNIGIHLFDLLIWLFGAPQRSELHVADSTHAAGFLELEQATVSWYLSIDHAQVPKDVLAKGVTTYRSIQVDGTEIEFSDGFTGLHTRVYENVLEGGGFGLSAVRPSIELVYGLRHAELTQAPDIVHPLLRET